MSADGKIADSQRQAARFASKADRDHLESQIALTDAVMFGAGTLRAYGTTLSVSNSELLQARQKRGQPPQPLQIVCSTSVNLDPNLPFFRQPVPRWLLTTTRGAQYWQSLAIDRFEQILVADGEDRQRINWPCAFRQLASFGCQKVAVLGGGELIASLLAEDLIHELWLTVCPVILGGVTAPTPVDGQGFFAAKPLKLMAVKQVEDEVFLHYGVLKVSKVHN
jgi:5-amino-6-(5-phosphoribosylamino)uracil reductase